jgi:hypothetical protein
LDNVIRPRLSKGGRNEGGNLFVSSPSNELDATPGHGGAESRTDLVRHLGTRWNECLQFDIERIRKHSQRVERGSLVPELDVRDRSPREVATMSEGTLRESRSRFFPQPGDVAPDELVEPF